MSEKQIKDLLLIEEDFHDLATFFKVFSDSTRLKIIQVLSFGPLCVSKICECTGFAQSTVSHQLATLRQSRLVRAKKSGKSVIYELTDNHVMNIFNDAFTHIKE